MDKKKIKTIYRTSTAGDGFTIIGNGLLQDTMLSSKTRGFICMLLSHPTTWEIEITHLVKTYMEGKNAVYKMIAEARERGYMGRFIIKNEKGHNEKYVYWVTDDPNNGPEISLENDEEIIDVLGQNPRERKKNIQLPTYWETGGEVQLSSFQETGTDLGQNIQLPNNPETGLLTTDTLYKKINKKLSLASYAFSEKAFDLFCVLQPKHNFKPVLDKSPQRLEALRAAILMLGGDGESGACAGWARWQELLERACGSPWCRGEQKPNKNYKTKFQLSVDDMANPRILEKLATLPLRLVPGDPRWNLWRDWSKANDQKTYRIMLRIEDGMSQATGWEFKSGLPPEITIHGESAAPQKSERGDI